MTITELKKKRAALIDDASAINRAAELAGRELDDKEVDAINGKIAEADTIAGEIEAMEKKTEATARLKAMRADLDRIDSPRNGAKADAGRLASPVSVRARWQDDPNKGFESERKFYMAVLSAGLNPGGELPENLQYLRVQNPGGSMRAAAGSDEQSTFSDPYGGFWIPRGFSPNMLSVPTEADPIAGRTTKIPMAVPSVDIPARTDKDHTTSVSGGLRVYRRAEADTVTASRMQMELVKLDANDLMGITYATERVIKYSPQSVAALLSAGFRQEFASRMLKEKIRGTGAGEYLGILNSPCLITVNKEVGQDAATITGANVLAMRKRSWNYSGAVWLANHDTYDQLATLHVPGTNTDVFLFNPTRGEDIPDMLLGRPIFFVEDCSTLGTVGDLILGTWSEYLEGTLEELESAESIHVRFVNAERTFRFTMANDGAPWWRSALTPKNSTSTLSPFVVLQTRS